MSDQDQKKKIAQKFKKLYSQLNKEQKLAVDTFATDGGPIMVMAGPGTGKTQVLATAVANVLDKQDINPQNILALTFTDSAAQNMRERIVSMIGAEGYYVNIMTFHSFAADVISHYPEKFSIDKGSEPLSDFEKFEIFEQILLNTKLEEIKPMNAPLYYVKHVISQISQLKREYITPEDFESILDAEEMQLAQDTYDYWQEQKLKAKIGKRAKTKLSSQLIKQSKNLSKQKDLQVLYIKYLSELKNRKRYDFDDMISYVVRAFETDEELLLDYQERFQYILVDEYQDTNAAQNKIVELLASFWEENPNVFVVGDPHQSIFRFQGASTENMLEFIDKYPKATVITLTTGYRCSDETYGVAAELISNNSLNFDNKDLDKALSTKLQSATGSGEKVKVYVAESETLELLYLVEEISKLHKSGVPLNEIAVLYRNNKEAAEIKEFLEKWGIEYDLAVGGNVLDDLHVQQLLTFFQVLQDLGRGNDTEDLFTVMQYPWIGTDVFDVYRLARISGRLHTPIAVILEKSFEDIVKLLNGETYGLSRTEFSHLVNFKNKLLRWYQLSHILLFNEWFSLIINDDNSKISGDDEAPKPNGFGFMNHVLSKPVKTDHLYAINSLYSEIKSHANRKKDFNLDNFLNVIQVMMEHGVGIKVEDLNINQNRVSLSTAHGSKGKEWQYVFVVGLTDKKWGNQRTRELIPLPDSILTNTDITKKEKNEDDRRLFYVAITRSSVKTYLLWSKTKINGKEMMSSMFLNEIEKEIETVSKKESKSIAKRSEKLLEKILTSSIEPEKKYEVSEKAFFKHVVDEFNLSVTALNNYLKDPHEFLVNSLLRIPRAKSPILSFGTAVHSALEYFYVYYKDIGKILPKNQFLSGFEMALSKENLIRSDYIERRTYGRKILTQYYDKVLIKPVKPLMVEKYFGGKLNRTIIMDGKNEIRLSGRIDRVDLINKKENTVRVIDYKTGRPKSDNVINGQSSIEDYSNREKKLPESIRGRYQRQLVFYKLLAELDRSFPYVVKQAEFDFIEPGGSHKDKHIVRSFSVSDQAVEDLKNLIKEVMGEIRSLAFLEE